MFKHTAFLFCSFILLFGSLDAQDSNNRLIDSISLLIELDEKAVEAIRRDQLDSVPEYIIKSRNLANKIDIPQYKALNAITLALFYYKLENYGFAAAECAHAIYLTENLPPTIELGFAYHMYALVSVKTRNFSAAKLYFESAENVFKKLRLNEELEKIKLNRGRLAFEEEDFELAKQYAEESLEGFRVAKMLSYEAQAELLLAESLVEIVKNDRSKLSAFSKEIDRAIRRAVYLAEQNDFIDLRIQTYRVISDLAILEDRYFDALEKYTLFSDKRDSLNHTRIDILNKYLNLENSEAELNAIIASQEIYLAEKNRSAWMNRITTGLSIFLITILSLLTLALYKNNIFRNRTFKLLQDKNNELTTAKEKAEKASLAKAQFLSAVTHELRTPMYAVTGITQLLLDENPREDQKEHLKSLKFSGDYLLSLINNILDLNKLEANKVGVEKKPFSLKVRAEEIIASFKKQAADKNNNLFLDFDTGIPENILGDKTIISQILINLVGNAIKFTDNGTVDLRVSNIKNNGQKALIRFEIEDDGIGISLEKQKNIFDSFIQGSLEINRKYGGTGLGLSIVKNLLILLNSEIHLESQPNRGSKFWFEVQFELPKIKPEKEGQSDLEWNLGISENETLHVLIVEDNKINQMITKKVLEKKKIQCTIIDNGKDAVEAVKNNNFDLILMDVHMPEMSGIEATQLIRKFNQKIPIIALTAVSVEDNLDEFLEVGFNDVIPKPFQTDVFFEKIYASI